MLRREGIAQGDVHYTRTAEHFPYPDLNLTPLPKDLGPALDDV
jgi:hypothetical protein